MGGVVLLPLTRKKVYELMTVNHGTTIPSSTTPPLPGPIDRNIAQLVPCLST